MIALRDNLPLVQFPRGQALAFEREWLVQGLVRAAEKAGHRQWWLAEHVAESVTEFLRTQRTINVIAVERLAEAVRSALEVIGYAEVARHFLPGRPRVRVSLLAMAHEAGAGYELAFFELLRRRVFALVQDEDCDFELTGLEPCVKVLRARKLWSRECEALRSEIVLFTRMQTALAAEEKEVSCALA